MTLYDFDFSKEKIAKILSGNKDIDLWSNIILNTLNYFDIFSLKDVSGILSQCQHESLNFTVLQENLNYSAKRLMQVFPKRFPNLEIALKFANNPEKFANNIYANRMGNGPPDSGDGFKFIGRGLIQITGKDNYRACSKNVFKSEVALLNDPELLLRKQNALSSACWFWNKNISKDLIEKEDIKSITRRINGGINGLEDRIAKYKRVKTILESE